MSFSNQIREKLYNIGKLESVLFLVSILLILIISILNNETPLSIIYAICGIIYTLVAGKGRAWCYIFGIVATCCYSYLALKNHVFGNCFLNACYYLPMQILGFFEWNKHTNPDTKIIFKTRLKYKEKFILSFLTILLTAIVIVLLKFNDDKAPYFDGTTTVLSLLGMYLTVKRCIEQWIIWIIVDALAVLMWIKLSILNHSTFSTVIVWGVYLVLGVYFYNKWKNEFKPEIQ